MCSMNIRPNRFPKLDLQSRPIPAFSLFRKYAKLGMFPIYPNLVYSISNVFIAAPPARFRTPLPTHTA